DGVVHGEEERGPERRLLVLRERLEDANARFLQKREVFLSLEVEEAQEMELHHEDLEAEGKDGVVRFVGEITRAIEVDGEGRQMDVFAAVLRREAAVHDGPEAEVVVARV